MTEPQTIRLAAIIRKVDGNHDLGAGALADALIENGVTLAQPAPLDAERLGRLLNEHARRATKRERERYRTLVRMEVDAFEAFCRGAFFGPDRDVLVREIAALRAALAALEDSEPKGSVTRARALPGLGGEE